MEHLLELAKRNQERAWEVIRQTDIINIWKSVGAEINLVGSLNMGLLMKHKDIDFHIYTSPFRISDSFQAMARLAENPLIKRIEYGNSLDTEERCVEWHAWFQDPNKELWQIDMMHKYGISMETGRSRDFYNVLKGSRYDGYFEKMAERITAVLTDETRQAILKLKYETPDTAKIMGVEYYQAVIQDGVRTYAELEDWKKQHPVTGVIEWIP
mgnify:CR=1 FL=1